MATDAEDAVRVGLHTLALALRQEVDVPQRTIYVRALRHVPADVIREAVVRLVREPGRRFFPTVPEWLGACAAIIDERRQARARQARALMEDCPDCGGSGWREVERGVVRCTCHRRAQELLAGVPAALPRPALVESTEEAGE